MEALNRGLNPRILIFNNGSAGATGGQLINDGLLNKALEPFSEYVKEISIAHESEKLPDFFAEIKESRKLRIGRIITADYEDRVDYAEIIKISVICAISGLYCWLLFCIPDFSPRN